MIKIPQNLKFSQTNTGDLSGNVHITKNISFDTEGRISLAPRLRSIFDSDTYTDLVTSTSEPISKFVRNGAKTWVIGRDTLYYITSTFSAPYGLALTKDTTSGTPTTALGFLDGCVFQSDSGETFCVANYSDVKYYNGSTWTTVSLGSFTTPTLACVFENKRALAVSNTNKIILISSAFAVPSDPSLTLPPNYSITAMVWNTQKLYIGTQNSTTEECMVFEWDGASAEANTGYKIEAQGITSMVRYKDGVVVISNLGEMIYCSGGIKQLAVFPIFNDKKSWGWQTNSTVSYLKVLFGGMTVIGDKIYVGVDSTYLSKFNDDTSDYFENNFPSGVWCYDPKVGLYHAYSVDSSLALRTGAITTANVNTTTDIITIPSSICPDTGTPVFYDDGNQGVGTRISPLENGTRYFVIKVSGTTLKLATTKSNAVAGTAIDLTSTGNNNQTLVFCPNNGFGGTMQKARGVSQFKSTGSFFLPTDTFAGDFLVGGNVYKNDNSEIVSILSVAKGQENRGYEITPRITSDQVKDAWQKLFLKFNPLVNPDDKIIIKYRTTKPNRKLRKIYSNSIVGTWVNSTSFTTTEPRFAEVVVGDEIEIVRGAGSGYLAHITEIVLATGTYTVTIDETVENIVAGNTFYYTVDNWTKLKEINTSYENNEDGVFEIPFIEKKTAWVQLKIELRGIDIKIEQLQINNETFKPSK